MAEYRYEAVDPGGAKSRGRIAAPDAAAARSALRDRALLPVKVDLIGPPAASGRRSLRPDVQRPLNPAILSRITRQIATLLANGIRVEDALALAADEALPARAAKVLTDIRRQITDGQGFAAALAGQGRSFPKPYIAVIAAGETSGRLDVVMQQLAEHTETAWANRRTIVFALIYPGFLAFVSALIITLLMTRVVPDILAVYQRRGTELPVTTEILLAITDTLRSTGPFLVVIGLLLAGLATWLKSTPAGQKAIDARALKLPVIGSFLKQKHAAQIAATLAILVQSGVPLVRALKVAAEVSGNSHVRSLVRAAASEVGDGAPLDGALKRTGILPKMMLSMIAGGIRSGELGAALAWTGRNEQAALDQKLKALTALIEPLILLVMGGIILFIVMAILSPITRLNSLAGV